VAATTAVAGHAREPVPLPTAAVLSDAVKAAQSDVEEALRQDRTLERQRDWMGAVGVFQARDTLASQAAEARASHKALGGCAQGVGARLFAVSVAKLLLLAAVLAGVLCAGD
jgi:hypothetical protein